MTSRAFDGCAAASAGRAGKRSPTAELPRWLALVGELAQSARRRARSPSSRRQLSAIRTVPIALRSRLRADRCGRAGDRGDACCGAASRSSATARRSCASWSRRSRARSRTATRSRCSAEHARAARASFLCRYLYAFNAAMTGRLDVTRAALPRARCPIPRSRGHDGDDRGDRSRAPIASRGARRSTTRDLRGWHYVLTGCLLAHQSPYGFDEPMHGRYAWLRTRAAGRDRARPARATCSRGCDAAVRVRAARPQTTRSSHARRRRSSSCRSRRGRRSACPRPASSCCTTSPSSLPADVTRARPAAARSDPVRAREPVDAGQPGRARRHDAALSDIVPPGVSRR